LNPLAEGTCFSQVSEMIAAKARAVEPGFTHLIIEKPFGARRGGLLLSEVTQCSSRRTAATR
jgi:hypothetical protein